MALEDTQPILILNKSERIPPPPRILFYAVIMGFVLMLIMPIVGVYTFQQVLRPAQQQRVISIVSFMEAFLPSHPNIGDALPTVMPAQVGDLSADDLLNLALSTPIALENLSSTIVPTSIAPSNVLLPTITPIIEAITPAISTPTLVPTPAPVPIDIVPTVPASGRLYGFRYEQQTWNNCGPASITTALSYYGWQEDQEYARRIMRPDREDKNVSPNEMVAFVNQQSNIRALWRIGGTLDIIRLLVANDFPVIIGTGYMPEGYDWLGHYQTVVGFEGDTFYVYDSFIGTGNNGEGYARLSTEVDRDWQHFNRRFIVLYPLDREVNLFSLLGQHANANQSAELAFEVAQQEARINPSDGFSWFNMGSSLVALGRYEEAASAFDRATQVELPWRMLWYQFEPYEAYFNTGRYSDVLIMVQANLNNGGQYVEETYYWQGRVFVAQGQIAEARTAFRNALNINPNYEDAQIALNELG